MFREWERETISTIMEMNSDISTIMEICDMMCFRKGEAIWRHSGVISGKELKAIIEQNS